MSDKPHRRVSILPRNPSMREAYLTAFVETTNEHYKKYITLEQQFSDGIHYTGYIWDCLHQRERITYERFCLEIQKHQEIFAFADNHSRDRVMTPPLWPFPPNSVISLSSELLLQSLPVLPQDLYVFDASLSWTVVLTHEYDDKRRWCFSVGITT